MEILEYFRDRLAVLGEIVIAERACGIGIVEIDELAERRLCFVDAGDGYWAALSGLRCSCAR
jgi:hypothetical protein